MIHPHFKKIGRGGGGSRYHIQHRMTAMFWLLLVAVMLLLVTAATTMSLHELMNGRYWQRKFTVREEMLPIFLTHAKANIYNAGKVQLQPMFRLYSHSEMRIVSRAPIELVSVC